MLIEMTIFIESSGSAPLIKSTAPSQITAVIW